MCLCIESITWCASYTTLSDSVAVQIDAARLFPTDLLRYLPYISYRLHPLLIFCHPTSKTSSLGSLLTNSITSLSGPLDIIRVSCLPCSLFSYIHTPLNSKSVHPTHNAISTNIPNMSSNIILNYRALRRPRPFQGPL